jgi:2-dehydropantoate 2-reductase
VGPGAMGSLLAAHFHKGGARLSFLARSEDRAKELREKGFLFEFFESSEAEELALGRIHCPVLSPDHLALDAVDFHLILLCVKSYTCLKAVATLAKIPSEAPVLVFQNGLSWPEQVASLLPRTRIFGAVTHQAALRVTSEGVQQVIHKGVGATQLAPLEESEDSQKRVLELVSILNEHGLPTTREPSLRSMLWGKAVVNAAINALTALLLIPNGALLSDEQAAALADRAALEAWQIAKALGVELNDGPALWREVAEKTAGNGSSTLQDVVAGRKTEVEAINGVIAEHGRKLGLDVSTNRLLWTLIAAREHNYKLSQSMLNVNWLLQGDSALR